MKKINLIACFGIQLRKLFASSIKKYFFLIFTLLLSLSTYAQKNFELNIDNATIEEIIKEIESQSDFKFYYQSAEINKEGTKSVKISGTDIVKIMNKVVEGTQLKFKVVDQYITISSKNKKSKTIEISGSVTDSEGSILPGVTVVEMGSSNGVITDIDGKFNLKVQSDGMLEFSYVGMSSKQVKVDGNRRFDIQLMEDRLGMEEVVVVGYGTQKKVNLTGAVASIAAKEFEEKSAASAVEVLQGRVAGFNVSFSGGGIDSDPSLNVRGITNIKLNSDGSYSTQASEPLILIDNIPSSLKAFSQMNTEDIESVSVLKDASSAAIYGGRAAYGVVLVTTKKGKGKKVNITASYNRRISQDIRRPEFISHYDRIRTTHLTMENNKKGDRMFDDDHIAAVKAYHDDPKNNPIDELTDIVKDSEGNIIDGKYHFYGTTDFIDETFEKYSVSDRYSVSMSGGFKNTDIYASASYVQSEGMFKIGNEEKNTYNFRMNINSEINKHISMFGRAVYFKNEYDTPFDFYGDGASGFYKQAYHTRTFFPLKNPYVDKYTNHPLAFLASGARDVYEDDDIKLTGGLNFNILKGLTARLTYSYNSQIGLNKENVDKIGMQDNSGYVYWMSKSNWSPSIAKTSRIFHRTKRKLRNILDAFVQYENTFFDKHNFSVLAGFNQEDYNYLYYNVSRKDLISPSIPSLKLTLGEKDLSQSAYHWAVRGAFYRVNYSYDDKYLIEFNGRYDGTSKFHKDNRFGFFPSASAGWVISKEPFMKFAKPWVNFLKFTGSYGTLGNQEKADTYAYIATMGNGETSYLFGGAKQTYISQSGLKDPNITWETVTTKNFGYDIRLLDSKLTLEGDVYIRDTKDMLVPGDKAPGILGTNPPTKNAADLQTKGWSFNINWRDVIGDFNYGIGFLMYDSRSEITKFDNPTGSLSRYRVDEELGEIWGYETEGYFKDDEEAKQALKDGSHDQSFISGEDWKGGDIKFKDLNGDGKIDQGNKTIDDSGDLKIIGNTSPRYNYGINLEVGWKGLSVAAFFQGVGQREFFPTKERSIFFPLLSKWDNVQTHQLDRWWTPENPDAYFARPEHDSSRNYATQTKYLQDASYIRLKNLSINYTMPKNLVKYAGLNSMVLTLQGQNLWDSHDLPEPFDPEGGNGFQVPFKKFYTIGVKVTL